MKEPRKKQPKPRYITLREAGAMVMNPDNPQLSYAEIDQVTNQVAHIYLATRRISYGAAAIAVTIAVMYAASLLIVASPPALKYAAVLGSVFLCIALLTHPITISKTFVGALLVPKGPEGVEDLMDRLARGELSAHWGDDGHPMVDIADIRLVIADRQAEAALPPSQRPPRPTRHGGPIDRSLKLEPDPMPDSGEIVDPATLDDLNAAPASAFLRMNTAYAFILGGGDRTKGEAELRRMERQSHSIIRQPDTHYMEVTSLRAFLKEQGYEGVGGSPWDRP